MLTKSTNLTCLLARKKVTMIGMRKARMMSIVRLGDIYGRIFKKFTDAIFDSVGIW